MRIHGFAVALIVASVSTLAISAQSPDTIAGHIAAAKAAAGTIHPAIFNQLCAPGYTDPATLRAAAARRGAPPANAAAAPAEGRGRAGDPPPRSAWHVEPVRVFDNLYWVGQTEFGAWALKTSAGIIIIDALYDYSVDDEIV